MKLFSVLGEILRVVRKFVSFCSAGTALAKSEFDDLINQVNSHPDSTWVAGHNFHENYKIEDVAKLCGAYSNKAYDAERTIPERFNKVGHFPLPFVTVF